MTSDPNQALCDVLDGEDTTLLCNGDAPGASAQDREAEYYEEHVNRLKAEGEAADVSRRLVVAQEQITEFAQQRTVEAAALLAEAEKLEAATHHTFDLSEMHRQLAVLKQRLAEAAADAQAFAAQQKADAERTKRSFSQANLAYDNTDTEMKRMREHADEHAQDEEDEGSGGGDDGAEAEERMGEAGPSPRGGGNFAERARYIPLRLSADERRLLRLLEAALSVSEYTDKVDIHTWKSKTARIHAQIKDLCAILCGLVVASDYRKGQALVADRTFKHNEAFFQDVFEVGRRHKIMNPDKMRVEYGKLMYLLMDSCDPAVAELLDFSLVRPLRTVWNCLAAGGGTALLSDPLVARATGEIAAGERPRADIQRDIRAKERARDALARKYCSPQLSEEAILRCLYSIADNNAFLLFNRDPVDRMIGYLTTHFRPEAPTPNASLAIAGGVGGARLTHSHERQFHYVLQSLTLWREISHEMFKLWCLADGDMLRAGNVYRLTNTGQGLNRVQQAPGVSKAMHAVLWRCQQRIGSWVGSAVIHLGDHNVPNALMFIDKYTQVPRILNPVVLVLDELPKLCRDAALNDYVAAVFGSVEACRKSILLDFFRHAFDGGGADNFFDAGSCIDGRLTSAWNWGAKVEKKPYYHIFKVAGFSSFDGDLK